MVRAHLSLRHCSGYKEGLILVLSRDILLHPPVQKLAGSLVVELGDHGIEQVYEVGPAPGALGSGLYATIPHAGYRQHSSVRHFPLL